MKREREEASRGIEGFFCIWLYGQALGCFDLLRRGGRGAKVSVVRGGRICNITTLYTLFLSSERLSNIKTSSVQIHVPEDICKSTGWLHSLHVHVAPYSRT